MSWRTVELREAVELQRGYDLPEQERRPGAFPIVGSAGPNGSHERANVRAPGVVIGRSGAGFGSAHYCEIDFWALNTGLFVKDFRNNHPRFIFYVLDHLDFSKYNSGGAQPSLNRNFIYPILVRLPERGEQEKIADVLAEWDAAIENTERLIAAKERHREALIARLYALSDRTGKPSRFGDILRESTEVGTSGRHARKLTVKLYGKGVLAKAEKRQGSEQTQYFARRAGQLIYSKLDFLNGAFGIIPPELDGYESTLDLPAFEIASATNPVWLLGYLTRHTYYTRQVGLARGQRKARRVHPSDLLASSLRTPPREVQDQIADILAGSRKDIDLTRTLAESLKAQKRGLMQKLLTGQWRLPLPETEVV